MQTFLRDLRYVLRRLHRSLGFTLTAVLTLALGIGTTTAIFTLVYDAMLKPLPFAHPKQLVVLQEQVAEFRDIYPQLPLSANHFDFWQRNSRSFQSMAAMQQSAMPLGTGGHPLQVQVIRATPGIFSVLGLSPQLGRAFTAEEAQPGHDREIILTYNLWRTQFQGDPRILGRSVTLNGFPYSVLGVMPRSFHLPFVEFVVTPANQEKPVDALVPLAFSKDQLQEAMGDFNYFGVGRMKPGVTPAQASAELNALQHAITANLPPEAKGTLSAVLTPYQQAIVGANQKPLFILLAAVAGLLLVGCINIANLILARAAGRRQQVAVAMALGAKRAEILRMAMSEPIMLAALGGVFGVLLALVMVPVMQRYLPPALNFRGVLHLDWVGAACALLLAIAATLLAGAVPAWISSRTHPQEVLHSESHLASESRGSKRMRRALVAAEVAVSVALVLLTGLLTVSLIRLMSVDRGFLADRVMTAKVNLPIKAFPDTQSRAQFYASALQRLHQLPGVEGAAMVSVLPLDGDYWIDMARIQGDTRPFMQLPSEHFRWISPGYFETLHLPLIAGRDLTASDQGKYLALISQSTAHALWPGKDAVGRQFVRGDENKNPFTVIGIVKDARTITLARPDPLMIYVPYWYRSEPSSGLLVRTRQDPAGMADAIRKTIWSVNSDVSVPLVRTLSSVVADSVAGRRFEMDLLMLFASTALLLAGLGVYGVVTYSVVQRQREIGLRLALGAARANIYWMVLRDGLAPVLAGAAAGIAFAITLAHIVASLLFEVSPFNPAILAATIFVLVAVGATACLIPARRAGSVDPMQALRTE
jgi:predicted permease